MTPIRTGSTFAAAAIAVSSASLTGALPAYAHPERAGQKYIPTQPQTRDSGSCPYFRTWEDGPGGVRVHASIQFRASDTCNGRHVKRAYVRILRTCWPKYDSGRIYATSNTSGDRQLQYVEKWAYDSPKSGCNTNTYYDWEYWGLEY